MYIHPCNSCKFVYRVYTYNIEQFNSLTDTIQYKTQYNNFTEYVTYNTAADTITASVCQSVQLGFYHTFCTTQQRTPLSQHTVQVKYWPQRNSVHPTHNIHLQNLVGLVDMSYIATSRMNNKGISKQNVQHWLKYNAERSTWRSLF